MTTREVVLDGGSPWGFRLHGGADQNQPLRISRVNPGSKAALRGIREGDFITSINNQSTKDITNAEAHALLRNSGDTLKLGLNEDCNGSPKRRQYKTVHQETHSETVKKSSVTSYTVTSSKTISQTEASNELKASNVNGHTTRINGDSNDPTRVPVVSQRSTLSSTCSSSSSTPSTYTSVTSPSGTDMADNARSRRKRTRNNRKKTKSNVNTVEINETIVEEAAEYSVESPKRVKSPEAKKPVKSRSFDDDCVKIQELSEVSESEDKSECKAIVSEAESDIDWEIASKIEDTEIAKPETTTVELLLDLDECTMEQPQLISPEEELTLRNFLEGLNLVNSPEDAFKQVRERELSTVESIKARRARKRAILEQYFTPIMQNPRFLEVISEETSDLSDREQPSLTHHLKQGTPEPEVPPQRPPRRRKEISNPTFLVSTKIMDVPICSTNIPQSSSEAEVVYLEDSSNSTTPDPKSDNEEEKDTTMDMLSSANSSVADLRETETTEESRQVRVSVKKNDVLVSSSESISGEIKSSPGKIEILEGVSELTPPPTPENEQKLEEIVEVHQERSEVEEDNIVSPYNIESFLNTLSKNKDNISEEIEASEGKEESGNVQIVHTNKANPNRKIQIIKLDDLSPPIVISPKHNKYVNFDSVYKKIEDSANPESPKETRVPILIERNADNFNTTNIKKTEVVSSPPIPKKEITIPITVETSSKPEEKVDAKEASLLPNAAKIEAESSPKEQEYQSTSSKETIIPVVVETEQEALLVQKDEKIKNTLIPTVVKATSTKPEQKNQVNPQPSSTKETIIPVVVETSSTSELKDVKSEVNQKFQPKSLKETIIPVVVGTSATKTEQKNNQREAFLVHKDVNETLIPIVVEASSTKTEEKKIDSQPTKETIIPVVVETSSTKPKEVKTEVKQKFQPRSLKETIIPVVFETYAMMQKDGQKNTESSTKETDSQHPSIKETIIPVVVETSEKIEPKEEKIKTDSSQPVAIKETIIPVILESSSTKTKQKDGAKETRIPVVVETEKKEPKLSTAIRDRIEKKFREISAQKSDDLLKREKKTQIDTPKEVNIPITLEKDLSSSTFNERIVSSSKEVIVPITIEKNSNEIESKASSIFKKIRVEATPVAAEEKKEFTIPISVEGEKKSMSSPKEVIIPISIDHSKSSTKYEKFSSLRTPKKELETVSIFKDPNSPVKQVSVTSEIESPSKEVESICQSKAPESMFYSNVLSPPAPSPSPSLSSGSSSRATSLCTAKYNPMNSSIADITSIKETPPTLRELCVNFLMALPFGADILQELADVSSSIEHLTKNLCSEDKWVGLPTEDDPRLLVCLSPTQKCELEKSRKVGNEASKLLDLHSKFIYRTSYHDDGQAKTADVSNNRLLAIIRDAEEPKTRKFSTLPRDMETARLKAKDLSEWLELARNKSRSNLNLSKDENKPPERQRRSSLPPDFYEQQMQYLREKEREIERELEMLEEEKWRLAAEMAPSRFKEEDFHISRKGDFAEKKSRPVSMPVATEFFRQQMYEEYMGKMAEREERKQQKVIKVKQVENSPSARTATGIEDEFMNKVKEKQKLGKLKTEEDSDKNEDDEKMPKHLREFMDIAQQAENSPSGVWSPGQKQETQSEQPRKIQSNDFKDEPISPVWTPKSATSSPTVERKEFRPVKFESPVLGRKNYKGEEQDFSESSTKEPPWRVPETSSDTGVILSSTLEKRLPTSHSSPASGFSDFPSTRLPKAQNPTITLLQKARGQLPKGALYIEQEQIHKRPQNDKPPMVGPGEILYKIKNEYASESDGEKPRKMADLGPRKFEGIGPTTKDGMPLILRSEIKDANQSKWYKRMYDTIHKQRPHRDEYVTVRYKQRRGQYPYTSGYLSEPEPGAYDSDFTDYKYATLDRRRANRDKENDYVVSSTMPRSVPDKVGASVIKHGHEPYKNQPGRIENYIPGHSSISEKEAKEWWDEVMDIFDGHLEQQKRVPQTKSFINQALKESGYESDSTLVFRRRDDTAQQLSPSEQKEAYKIIQKGGDIPLHGLRKPAPERPKEPEPPVPPPKGHHGIRNLQQESPRKYVENEVTIHYKTPVRQEIKEYLSEDELAHRQAEAMKKIYQEERRRKYLQVSKSLQELQDMNNRRHTDNFIPSQKSPIPLNRYDDFDDLSPPVKPRPRSPEPRLMARALYNFVGQTARELTFRKGDLIYVRRQVDKNWYEGELNAMVGLFPVNYVEIVPYDTAKSTPRKSHEGQARAKYNFVAQTQLELSLAKGELVIITRRVDDNWFEGKIGGRKGIFPVSYVDVLIDPSDPPPPSSKPVAAPAAHSLLLNGSAGGKESMGSHSYTPNLSSNQLTTSGSYHAKPVQVTGYGSLGKGGRNPMNQTLHIETQAEPIPYRALYKYLPQNDDELELLEGDTVFVLEKCDDGWYVGSSERTGAFGTFPGNYVEKI